jgi:hypothetical protein
MLLALLGPSALAGGDFPSIEGQSGFGPPRASPDGRHVALTRWDRSGLWSWDTRNSRLAEVSLARGAGFRPAWDGEALWFKAVDDAGQQVVRWEAGEARVEAEGARVGQPAPLGAGKAMWTRHGDGIDADLVEPDPQGKRLAWDDASGVLHVRDLGTGRERRLPEAGRGSHPAWSSDGDLLVHRDGTTITVVEAASGRRLASIEGRDPAFVPGTHQVLFSVVETGGDLGEHASPYEILSAAIWRYDVATGRSERLLDHPAVHPRYPTPVGSTGAILFVDTRTGDLWRLRSGRAVQVLSADAVTREASPPPPSAERVELEVPYMHQLWDTPDDFNGSWSCGPTSLLQTLAAWAILPEYDITCSWPSSHTSHWGWYVPNVYSFNGYTYDTWGEAAGGECQGAHGFVCREYGGAVWAYMIDFMEQHGVGSSQLGVDFSALVSEIDAGYPVVASASVLGYGHILVIRGYVTDGGSPTHTMVVNDPYGDAGTGDWGNFDGEDIVYDWPGYNNGNLEIELAELFSERGPSSLWEEEEEEPPEEAEEPADTGGTPGDDGGSGLDTGEGPLPDTGTDGGGGGPDRPSTAPGTMRAMEDGGGCSAVSGPTWLGIVGVALLVTLARPCSRSSPAWPTPPASTPTCAGARSTPSTSTSRSTRGRSFWPSRWRSRRSTPGTP